MNIIIICIIYVYARMSRMYVCIYILKYLVPDYIGTIRRYDNFGIVNMPAMLTPLYMQSKSMPLPSTSKEMTEI